MMSTGFLLLLWDEMMTVVESTSVWLLMQDDSEEKRYRRSCGYISVRNLLLRATNV